MRINAENGARTVVWILSLVVAKTGTQRWNPADSGMSGEWCVLATPLAVWYKNAMARGPAPPDARSAAEKAFKAVTTKPADLPVMTPSLPGVKETVSLRIDRDVLEFFQNDGPGWQDRINAALRKAAGK
jgi:uncharacterized protein (DUF4415 family)